MLFCSQIPEPPPQNRHIAPHCLTDNHLVFVDIESGGLQTWRPIIQIAAIAVDSSFRELEVFEEKIRFDERRATARTLRRRHYNRFVWKRDARRAKDVAVEFSGFLARNASVGVMGASGKPFVVAQLVAHNAEFDGPFLRAWFERQRLFFPGSYRVLCTMHRAMWFFHENPSLPPPDDFKLGTLCRYFGVPWNPRKAHDALADVRATVELYRAMIEHQCRSGGLPVAIDNLAV
jgi:hypothetical protein